MAVELNQIPRYDSHKKGFMCDYQKKITGLKEVIKHEKNGVNQKEINISKKIVRNAPYVKQSF